MRKSGLFVFTLFLLFSSAAHSALILKIKGRKALVDLEGVQASRGDKFDALNLYGKALGLLEIKQIKRGKAVAVLLKGKMGVNWILEPSAQEESSFTEEDEYSPSKPKSSYGHSAGSFRSKSYSFANGVGFIAGLHFNSISTEQNKFVSGSSLLGTLFMDFFLVNPLAVRFMLGYQNLIATGTDCGLSKCNLLVHYPLAGILLRAVFLNHLMFQPWVGAGGFLFWPFVDQTADLGLDKKSFSSFHGAVTAAAGVDIHFLGFYIPIQIDLNWVNLVIVSLQSLKEGSRGFKPFYFGIKGGIAFSF